MAAAEEAISARRAELEERAQELAARDQRIDVLERVATKLSERVVEREGELRWLRAELARVTQEGDAHLATLTALMGELEDIRRTARGQATRIRLGALREAAALSERLEELTEAPSGVRERLVDALTDAVERIGSEDADEVAVVAARNGHREVADAPSLFDGLIEVEIGPLSDFAQLVLFEDAAKSINATEGISVTRFSDGRATLEVSLTEPVALLRELEERCDLEFVVRDMREDRVVLDVDA